MSAEFLAMLSAQKHRQNSGEERIRRDPLPSRNATSTRQSGRSTAACT
jgi:hypothetical protein